MKTRLKMTLLLLAWLLMLLLNGFASATTKLGFPLKDLYQIFPFEFMPPAWAFMASRGLIFGLGVVFLVTFLVHRKKAEKSDRWHQDFFPYYMGIIALNIAWILTTTQKIWLISVIILLGMLIALYFILQKIKAQAGFLKYLGKAARGIYFGWITVAMIVLGISQVVWTFWVQSISDSSARMLAISAGVLASAGVSFFWLRNCYALLWSIFALGSAWIAFLN